jgi:predicted permease
MPRRLAKTLSVMSIEMQKLWALWCKGWIVLFVLILAVNAVLVFLLNDESLQFWEVVAVIGFAVASIGFYGLPIFLVSSGAVFGVIALMRHAGKL